MKTLFKIFSLAAAMTLAAGAAHGARMYYDSSTNDPAGWSTYATPTQSGSDYTATVSGLTVGTQYYIALSTSSSYTGIYTSTSTECSYTVNSGVQKDDNDAWKIGAQNYNRDNVRYQFIRLTPSVTSLLVSYNSSSHQYTITASGEYYTVSTSVTGCTISPASASVAKGDSARFTITPLDGYQYSSSSITGGTGTLRVSSDNKTFVVTPTANTTLTVTGVHKTFDLTASAPEGHGTVSPLEMEDVEYGSNAEFTVEPASGYYIDKDRTAFTGSADGITVTDSKVTLTYVRSAGVLNVYFKNDQKPVVYIGAYPVEGSGNTVNLDGYLADRRCLTVTAAGFYWSTSKDITLSEVTAAISESSTHIISAQTTPATAGTSFSKSGATLTGLSETKNVYFVAYATAGGNTNISDIVGLEFRYCSGIEKVVLTPSSAQLPAGFSATFSAVARGAGRSPVYTWYDGDDVISGATGSTLEYTMPDASSHTIKVVVSEESCGTSKYATASVSTCAAPAVSVSASPVSTTPWQPVTLTATVTNAGQGVWRSEPEAEIESSGFASGVETATLSAAVQSGDQTVYTVTYEAAGSQCGSTEVLTSGTVDVTIVRDVEDCTEKTE